MSKWRITRLNGEFCLTWDDDGKRRRYRLGTSDPKEAATLAPSLYAELTKPTGRSVADLWAAYTSDKTGRPVLSTMTHTWKALKPAFGHIPGEGVSVEDCRAYIASRRMAGRKDGSIHTELGHLRTVLSWAAQRRLIDFAPHIERPSKPAPRERFLTKDEVAAMIAAAKAHHIKLAILLLVSTGARVSAALELTWDRVDFQRGMINLRNPFKTGPRKGRATVPMNDTLRAELLTAKNAALSPFVIEWAGNRILSIKKGLAAAAAEAKLEGVSPHVLRHSAAVWLAEAGHSMSEIAQFLGHSNTSVTEKVYARFSPDYLRLLASSLEIKSAPRFGEPQNQNK